MLLGLISDIHANIQALHAVMIALERAKVDRILGLGDYVGYGGNPKEVIQFLRSNDILSVQGNHDRALCSEMDISHYRERARQAIEVHRDMLTGDEIDYLRQLPLYLRNEEIGLELGLSHGSPNPSKLQDFPYIFTEEDLDPLHEHFEWLPFVSFVGHSHLCKNFYFNHSETQEILLTRFQCLNPHYRYLITIGSAGQPRDRDPRAVAGIYDTNNFSFRYLRVEYDINAAAQAIINLGLSEQFAHRLYLGV